MKKHFRTYRIFSTLFILVVLFFTACDRDELSRVEQTRKHLTTGIWTMSRVTLSGTEKTHEFEGLTLQFIGNAYITTNGHVVWPSSGLWNFTDETGKTILRDDDVLVTIEDIASTRLTLSLHWDKTTLGTNGRTASVQGPYVFEFTK